MYLNLQSYTSNPAIISSLAWNAIRDCLTKQWKWELIQYIESVKITDKKITIKTGKPIINMELANYKESLKIRINEAFKTFGIPIQERSIVLI